MNSSEKKPAVASSAAAKGQLSPIPPAIKITTLLKKIVDDLERRSKNGEILSGATTGFIELDNKILGIHDGHLIVVGARPSMGKTSLGMNFVEHILFASDKPIHENSVLVFTMGGKAQTFARRMLTSFGSINQDRLRAVRLEEGDWIRVTSTIDQLAGKEWDESTKKPPAKPLYFDERANITILDIQRQALAVKEQNGGALSAILIDSFQRIKVGVPQGDHYLDMAYIARELKTLACEMDCPVIVLTHLHPYLEQRPNKRPILNDIPSSALVEEADLVMFIYRDEVYNKESREAGTAEIIIAKQTEGGIGTVRLAFQGQFTRFTNLSPEYYRDDED